MAIGERLYRMRAESETAKRRAERQREKERPAKMAEERRTAEAREAALKRKHEKELLTLRLANARILKSTP